MTNAEICTEIDRRFDARQKTPQGADIEDIIYTIAEEAGRDYADLKEIYLDQLVSLN